MRILTVALLFATSAEAIFRPFSVPFDDLVNGELSVEESAGIQQALAVTGLVALTGMPHATLKEQTGCLLESAGQIVEAADGTTRYTRATETNPSGMQGLFDGETLLSESCQIFGDSSVPLRTNVHKAVKAFAKQLDASFSFGTPLLESSHQDALNSVSDIVEHGSHLEHFHTYVKKSGSDENTLDWHVDQGLLLAFTPGRWEDGQVTDGFFLRTSEGEVQEIDFQGVSLVLMLGDGVNQYVNPRITQEGAGLRAVPHALQVPLSEQARNWYGLMVLPPPHAMHPVASTSFSSLRSGLIAGNGDALALGCSSDEHFVTATSGRRILHGDDDHEEEEEEGPHVVTMHNETHDTEGCDVASQAYCWHRCMTIPDEALACPDGQHMKCINPRSQLWKGLWHGDYFPSCIDKNASVETDFPKLPNFPRNDAECADFDGFVSAKKDNYTYQINLPDGEGAVFQWNVVENGTAVEGRLAFNGIFGYLSIGFAGYGGRNKMYNAPVIMALPASEYDPYTTGFDFSTPAMVAEYRTSGLATTFRGWNTPYEADERRRLAHGNSYSVEATDCFTELLFTAHTIAGKEFNLDGYDELIWGANSVDRFAQYHGENRGVFNVTWTSDEFAIAAESTSAATSLMSRPVVALGTILLAMMAIL